MDFSNASSEAPLLCHRALQVAAGACVMITMAGHVSSLSLRSIFGGAGSPPSGSASCSSSVFGTSMSYRNSFSASAKPMPPASRTYPRKWHTLEEICAIVLSRSVLPNSSGKERCGTLKWSATAWARFVFPEFGGPATRIRMARSFWPLQNSSAIVRRFGSRPFLQIHPGGSRLAQKSSARAMAEGSSQRSKAMASCSSVIPPSATLALDTRGTS
mmetsp:Transcript_127752/g.180262  ORF Transcript_127752/g.180262 Transcript_127752/m.180262 type:complete len:215 (-) Transcript_127752:89-733(-)